MKRREKGSKSTKRIATKLIATLLMVAMLLCMSTGVMAKSVDANQALENLRFCLLSEYYSIVESRAVNEAINLFVNDEIYIKHYNVDSYAAVDNVRRHALKTIAMETSPFWLSNGIYGASAPVIKQLPNYCGPASALQCLYALKKSESVAGINDDDKQNTLASEMGTNSNGTIVYRLTSVLNQYSKADYTYVPKNDMTIDNFRTYIKYSLYNDKPAILHARTDYLSYYIGYSSYHYIVVKGYNPATDKLVLADCNNTAQYRGEFTVSVQEAYNALVNDRYLIYG